MPNKKVRPFAIVGNGEDKSRRFHFRKFDEIQVNPGRAYAVKGLIPRHGLVLIWGPAKCGKSFWTLDLVLHIAMGREYRGHKVQQGLVFYLALEGGFGYGDRLEAFRLQRLGEHEGEIFFRLCGDETLILVQDVDTLVTAVRRQCGAEVPAVIVIDTVNRSLNGPEDDKTLGPYVIAADKLRAAFDCAVLLIHHSGYDKTHARGHTLLPAAVDAEIGVSRDKANNVVATVVSMRDGPADEKIASRLKTIDVGVDLDGDKMTSCYIEPTEALPEADVAKAKTKALPALSDGKQRALNILGDVVKKRGTLPPASLDSDGMARVARVDEWRTTLFDADVLDRQKANPRTDFQRIKDALVVRGLIGIDPQDEFVWLLAKNQPSRSMVMPEIHAWTVIGDDPDARCEHCGSREGIVYRIRDPFIEVAAHSLHEKCATEFFKHDG
jgi:KaiC/GvpD/RAD55 family RecA-like ATPase